MIKEKFETLSRGVWNNLKAASGLSILYGEETISDILLLELAKQSYFNIKILQTPKGIEAVQGTDWEWYVGSDKNGWIRYAIQAKKLNTSSNKYESIQHKIGTIGTNMQIDVLDTFATINKAIPLFCFYNYYPTATEVDHWGCHKPFDIELLGWTFTTLKNVRKALSVRGGRTFDYIHRAGEAQPIRCLFSCHKDIYQDISTLKGDGKFLEENFRKIDKLPSQFVTAREIGFLQEFPEQLYNPEIKIYPERVAIIEMLEE